MYFIERMRLEDIIRDCNKLLTLGVNIVRIIKTLVTRPLFSLLYTEKKEVKNHNTIAIIRKTSAQNRYKEKNARRAGTCIIGDLRAPALITCAPRHFDTPVKKIQLKKQL